VAEDVLDKIFSAAGAAWTFVLMFAVALFKVWPNVMGRFNERRRDRDTAEAADWERIRAERDTARAERDRVHALWVDCEEEKMKWQSRAITAEATLQGYGEARQMRAVEEATKRLRDGGVE
jgi:hypothetical protein